MLMRDRSFNIEMVQLFKGLDLADPLRLMQATAVELSEWTRMCTPNGI